MKKLLFILMLLASPAWAINPGEMFENPADEARAREIGRSLRCMVCQNQSIFDSNAGLAQDLRVLVRERMVAGDSDEDVLAYIHDRYGDYVLLEPPVALHTYALWIAPIGFMLIGGLALAVYHRRRAAAPVAPRAGLTEKDRAAARRLLEGEGS